jgi:hypothetical protein
MELGELWRGKGSTTIVRVIRSASASARLREARQFVETFPTSTELLLLGASRGSVDDFVRALTIDCGATFGLHRFSFTQLAARLAAADLARHGGAPATPLGYVAVATRAVFEAAERDEALDYFAEVCRTPGFPKALARTLSELRLAGASTESLSGLVRSGPDLSELLERADAILAETGNSDRASLFRTAAAALAGAGRVWSPMPILMLDVPFESDAEAEFLWTLVEHSVRLRQEAPARQAGSRVLITVPSGDSRTLAQLTSRGQAIETIESPGDTDLTRLSRHLFSVDPPSERASSGELIWFSAPGEGRECVEIARRLVREADRGVRFDEMAILVRSPQPYLGVLEHALGRAGIPAYFDRGTRRPNPTGRAFLAMLSCAVEGFSAKRFAEYLSLAQVPQSPAPTTPQSPHPTPQSPWVASTDESFGILSEPSRDDAPPAPVAKAAVGRRSAADAGQLTLFSEPETVSPDSAVVAGALRAPWKWESLLVESAVIGGRDRWARRLRGLAEEYRVRIRELRADDPDSPRLAHLAREQQNLDHLRSFALPLIETMGEWPERAAWGDWLARLEGLAPRVLRQPEHVLRVLADLRPMAGVGPVTLVEARDVLADRLLTLEVDPPAHRYGRVFVGSPHQARGRAFRVVSVPGLAERVFPQKLREDPLLLDDLRRDLSLPLARQDDRADQERLLLRLAVGAATERLYLSFPRLDSAEARQRVPSFYALDVMRAVTGRVPDHQTLEREAAAAAEASLAWPAPVNAAEAIDDFEHDLAVLRSLMRSDADVKGRAHYILRLNDALRRSVTERWGRARASWSPLDGIVRVTDATRPFLASQRLGQRPYSVSALQLYAACPYRFFLSAVYRLAPLEEPAPLQRMDPLTRGGLFHEVQAEFLRELQRQAASPNPPSTVDAILETLDRTLTRVAGDYYDRLLPAVDRVWHDEIATMRADLHIWARQLAAQTTWEPWRFEYAFGLPGAPGHDPASLPDPVIIDGRFQLRGSIDLVERKSGAGILRVTDHKTSKNRVPKGAIVGGGTLLQPVIYSLAIEAATGLTVESGRFSFCTSAGGFTEHPVQMTDRARRAGLEVLEIVDRAMELGMLPPAPAERACLYCDFVPVCGPEQERRMKRKTTDRLGDLIELRTRV